jgi:hypothetical protein
MANVVRLFGHWREPLRALVGTNASCRRLAPLPDELLAVTDGTPTIDDLRAAGARGRLSKFFDVNLTQLLRDDPIRDTLEVRILPGSLTSDDVMNRAGIVERLLDRCLDPRPLPTPPEQADEAVRELQRLTAGDLPGGAASASRGFATT